MNIPDDRSDAAGLWTTCSGSIRPQVSDAVWQTTFNAIQPLVLDDEQFMIAVPSLLVKERIEGRYLGLLRDALADAGMAEVDLMILVETEPANDAAAPTTWEGDVDSIDLRVPRAIVIGRPDHLGQHEAVNERYTFDAFVTGTSNRFAQAAALAVAETPARSYNPLFIYGAAGLGKTHLLQAIRQYVHAHYPTYTVRYVSTEAFLNQFVDAIRTNMMSDFKRRYREIDVLLVDDIQFMEGKEGLQEEFFHTFNSLHQANRQIVLSSDRPPDSIPTLEDRLRSRFKMGLITDIQPPDLETRMAILRKKAERDPFGINEGVLTFIAENITDNIRELEGALIRVTAYSSLTQQPLTVDLARRVLGDIVNGQQPRPITPRLILDKTSDMFGFPIEEITGQSRRRPLVTSRQIAMYVTRELTDLSYPAIAREFGGRDHTTVIHAVEKIGALMPERRQIYDQVTELIQRIKTGN
ncbi:MAG TPA: chromosomal replication initiator protein DnaA [Acidimicrobiales bacterium]|nr:chromosomal replication initiator protein DnaA [Acidimicrobiales bacterium]